MIETGKKPLFSGSKQEALEAVKFLCRVFNPRERIAVPMDTRPIIPLDLANKGNIRAFGDSGLLANGTRDRCTGEYQPDALDRFAVQTLHELGVEGWMSYNRAIPGSTSEQILREIQSEAVKLRVLATKKPDVIVIGWGGNDFRSFFPDQQTADRLIELTNKPLQHLDSIFPVARKFAQMKGASGLAYQQTFATIAQLSQEKVAVTGTPVAGIIAITAPDFAQVERTIVYPPEGSSAAVFELPIRGHRIREGIARTITISVEEEVKAALNWFKKTYPNIPAVEVSARGLEWSFDGTEHIDKCGQQALGKRSANVLSFRS